MSSPLKICLISPHYPPDFGYYGCGREAMELAQELSQQGHEITVIACAEEGQTGESLQDGSAVLRVDWKKEPRENSKLAHCLPRTRLLVNINMALWKGFLKRAQIGKFDVVDVIGSGAENLIPSLYDESPVVVFEEIAKPTFLEKELSIIGNSGFHFEAKLKDVFQSISSGFAANDTKTKDETPYSYMLDTNYFKPGVEKGVETQDRPTVIAYSSIGNESSQKLLVDIYTRVKAAVPDIFWLIVAHDIYSESSEGELKKVLTATGIDCDMVINRNMSKLLLPNLWSTANCGVLIDWYDFSPHALLEPLACGKPVVADLSGTDAAFLKDKTVVAAAAEFTGEAIAAKLVELLKNDSLADSIGKKARQYILENHCRKKMTEKRLQCYSTAIQSFAQESRRFNKITRLQKLLDYAGQLSDALDQMLYDLLFLSSVRFKVSHWLRKLRGKSASQPVDTVSK